MNKIKIIDLRKLLNFVVDNFIIWIHFVKENYDWIFKFEFQNFQTTSDGETTKMRVVDLEKLWNFVVDNFFIWNHLVKENNFQKFEIWIF
jgi:hypothetical protein